MSGLDFDDIHGDIAPALAEMSRLLRIVPLSSATVEAYPDPPRAEAVVGEQLEIQA